MKFGFVTCVQLGLSCIEKIYEIGGTLDVLITLHDIKAKKKSGRIYLDEFSKKHHVPLVKINHINDPEVIELIEQYDLDWLFIIGWSQIASPTIISAPKKGCIGMHPTLLPVGRGRAAIPWAIIKGLDKTGVSMFILDEGVDTGPILGQYEIEIGPTETSTMLYGKVEKAHETLMAEVFPKLRDNTYTSVIQDESLATEWEGRKPEDGELSLEMDIHDVDRLVRASTHPYPGAFLKIDGKKRIIWQGKIVESQNPNTINFSNGFFEVLNEDIVSFE
jgi:methionyl-tRNA formyltransferase